MVLHTYFDKNNTIIKGDTMNTARNPIFELFYGGDIIAEKGITADTHTTQISRIIFHFDETRLRELHSSGFYPDITKMKHTLKMTNTELFDPSLLGGYTCDIKRRASSFDLVLFKINQDWDEGVGYDYDDTVYQGTSDVNETNSHAPSNWYSASTLTPWIGGPGIYSGLTSGETIGTQHFNVGNENIEIDITDAVNAIITGDTNYGFGIAFDNLYEEMPTNELQYVGFFSRFTQTFFEPFVETVYDEHISDDRALFYKDKLNKLYLYVNLGNNPTDLDFLPTVTVYDNNGDVFSAYTGSNVTHVTKGIYSIDIVVPTSGYTDCVMFEDVWSNISINGIQRPDIELDFTLMDSDGFYNIGQEDFLPQKFGLSIHGIQREEQIIRGDIRKVLVSARIPYTINQTKTIDGLEYRLYTKEGANQYTVIDYQPVEMAFTHNYFLLDTNSLIPTTYYIDIRLTNNLSVKTYNDVISFDVVSITNYNE